MPELKLFRPEDFPVQTLPEGTTWPFKRPTFSRTLRIVLLWAMIALGFPLAIIVGFTWGIGDGILRGISKALLATYQNIVICWKALEK
mgnify:FL=1